MVKNKNYYIEELDKMTDTYGVDLHLLYGKELFKFFNKLSVWNDLLSWLTQWKESLPELPEINFDNVPRDSFNEIKQLVEKSRCILPLPNLFPSLARRFACCQSCSVSLRTLWAYGFDSAARRALEKSKVGEKEKYFIPFNQLYFLKSRLRSAIKTGESHPERAWS